MPTSDNTILEVLKIQKNTANQFQKRRHEDWNDIYTLFRGEIQTNRITQRQALNIPLMKETIRTLLAKIDDAPDIVYVDKGGDKQKELFYNELWRDDFEKGNFEGVDIQDKKTELMCGRAFKKLNFIDRRFRVDALDIYDVVVDPRVNPLDLETARYVVHQNIFRSAKEVLANEDYSKEGRDALRSSLTTPEGAVAMSQNTEEMEKKRERLDKMGVDFDELKEYEDAVNLSEHYITRWNDKENKFEKWVYLVANDDILLSKGRLKTLLGVDFYPFVSWADDLETQDFWSDGAGDIVKNINKITNILFSQMAENRALRGMGMYWFNGLIKMDGWTPATFEPRPFGMYPAPGNPNEAIQQVQIPELPGIENELNFLISLVEKATAATALEKGVSDRKQITLGEIQLLAGKTAERLTFISKFYRRAWKELAWKRAQIIDANYGEKDVITLHKKGLSGKMYSKEIRRKDWFSKDGYDVGISSSSEQDEERLSSLQRLMMVGNRFQQNPLLQEIIGRRMLEVTNLTPDEVRSVMDVEKQKMNPAVGATMPNQPTESEPKVRDEEAKSLLSDVQKMLV